MTAEMSCHYINTAGFVYYERPPDPVPQYACCGDCYCINGDEPCPKEVPNMNISSEAVELFKSMTVTNPINITCNPYDTQYTGEPCETTPPQDPELVALWDEAVCGALYSTNTSDANQCPAEYSLQSFPNKESAEAAGAVLTHWGACGVCSTTQDLAVYIESVDLTTLGVECSVSAIVGEFEDGVRCYMRAGYTRVRQYHCHCLCLLFRSASKRVANACIAPFSSGVNRLLALCDNVGIQCKTDTRLLPIDLRLIPS